MQGKLSFQDDQLVETAGAICEFEFVLGAVETLPGNRYDAHAADVLSDVAALPPGVPMQRPPDRPGNADESVQSGQTRLDRMGNQMRQGCSGPGGDGDAVHRDAGKGRVRQPQDDSRDPLVADEEIRAASQDARGDMSLVAAADDFNQFVGSARGDEVLGRAARLQPGVGSQGFVAARDVFEVLE